MHRQKCLCHRLHCTSPWFQGSCRPCKGWEHGAVMIQLRERLRKLSEVIAIQRKVLSLHENCPWWPVVVVALLQVAIFSCGCRYWWRYHRSVERPGTMSGEGLV